MPEFLSYFIAAVSCRVLPVILIVFALSFIKVAWTRYTKLAEPAVVNTICPPPGLVNPRRLALTTFATYEAPLDKPPGNVPVVAVTVHIVPSGKPWFGTHNEPWASSPSISLKAPSFEFDTE